MKNFFTLPRNYKNIDIHFNLSFQKNWVESIKPKKWCFENNNKIDELVMRLIKKIWRMQKYLKKQKCNVYLDLTYPTLANTFEK